MTRGTPTAGDCLDRRCATRHTVSRLRQSGDDADGEQDVGVAGSVFSNRVRDDPFDGREIAL